MTNELLTARLDREPLDEVERTIINAWERVETVQEIWVRYISAAVDVSAKRGMPVHLAQLLPGIETAYPTCKIYLGFRILDNAGRIKADAIEEEFQMRMFHERMEFKVIHWTAGRVPVDRPSRIWRRAPTLWTPTQRTP
jgi:hypothetical protein